MAHSDDTQADTITVDEQWITEWLEFGFADLEQYLHRQAQFDAYLRQRHLHRH